MSPFKIDAKILAVAPWGGNKRTLSPRVVELLGEHDDYRETFVGGCAILPRKKRSRWESINDANPAVVNVLRCVKAHSRQLLEYLNAMPFDREAFDSSVAYVAQVQSCDWKFRNVPLAAHQLAVWWMGPNGLAGTTTKPWFATRHTKTGGSPVTRWNSFRASIPALSERLQGVDITCEDFREVADPIIDRRGLSLYVDPPYFSKKFKYAHDFTAQDHVDLADLLNRFERARVVVSYYDAPELATLYPPERWERHEVSVSKSSANARTGATKTAATELLLVNRI